MSLRRAATTSVLVAIASLAATVVVWAVTGGPPQRDRPVAAGLGPDHVELVRAWDRRRAEAWAKGEPRLLRPLYTPDSRTGRRDVRMLDRYRERGLRVEGLRTQLLSVRAVREEADLLVLEVTDRVSAAEVVGEGLRRELPADAPSRREITWRQETGEWLVHEVFDLPGGAGARERAAPP
ncbi:hypothetical protein [Nocardioides campestrisoli]|uniref:hypothetical protein n=1 Tax=Nocardioides campestrisoli TaxID=2736757 RepID=UPI0015E7DC5C|nr:hypothetical protein [Nocardioides campestrisoli]